MEEFGWRMNGPMREGGSDWFSLGDPRVLFPWETHNGLIVELKVFQLRKWGGEDRRR